MMINRVVLALLLGFAVSPVLPSDCSDTCRSYEWCTAYWGLHLHISCSDVAGASLDVKIMIEIV